MAQPVTPSLKGPVWPTYPARYERGEALPQRLKYGPPIHYVAHPPLTWRPPVPNTAGEALPQGLAAGGRRGGDGDGARGQGAVSYTHLTLPTICSV
eukprot:799043-Prymnesium_polylepis.2